MNLVRLIPAPTYLIIMLFQSGYTHYLSLHSSTHSEKEVEWNILGHKNIAK